MSFWSHVNGSIRLEAVSSKDPFDFHTVKFGGTHKEWENCNVPCGSEGSLRVHVNSLDGEYNYGRFTINFYGDLRGFENYQEIIDWAEKIINVDDGRYVRDAVITINENTYRYDIEYNDKWEEKNKGFKLIHTDGSY